MRATSSIVLTLTLSAPASAQCQYSVFTWPQWQCNWEGPRTYTAYGLNDLGAWCGFRSACWPEDGGLDANWVPISCPANGTPVKLPLPPGASPDGAIANAVNDAGVVVGYMYAGQFSQYFVGVIWWPDGTVEEIPSLIGIPNSPATDINDAGTIVGYSGGLPYVLEDGVMTSIPSPKLGNGFALHIANSGDVTGYFGNLNLNARAFRWKDGQLVLLEPLAGFPVSYSNGVNSYGHVAGQSRTTTTPATGKPTIWIDDQPIELAMPAGCTTGGALAINDAGVITGYAQGPGVPSGYVVWYGSGGTAHLLQNLLVPGSGIAPKPVRINDAGVILGEFGPKLLMPIASPVADLDGDCAVDGNDLGVLLASWGAPDFDPRCDFNGDGIVNGDDLGTLLGEWTASR
ncbi:MAG: hypothetical protein FJ253_03330 [Phycisphaerae bacterium]|nr:hypothetical protein [Phycisphaerae bacterium]